MIDNKTLRTLEYDKILDQLAQHASFSAGEQAALSLRPVTNLEAARALIDQTSQARRLLEARPATHLGGARDVREAVRRAEVGSILTPGELLDIGSTLGASARFRNVVLKDDLDISWLRRQAQRMIDVPELRDAIEHTFSERGEVLDFASQALRRIRSDMHSAQGRLMERLNHMITSQEYRSSLQDSIVIMRNGRYVVPVRMDSRAKVPGIVHDQSSSGQTLFIEPLVVTEMNNRLKELELAEQREIERILQELSSKVAAVAQGALQTVEALRDVDLSFARAKYAGALRASPPSLNQEGQTELSNARHPLLTGTVVPITVRLGEDFRILLITGPNTGGKTVALKTTGLLTLMAQSGMHVPTDAGSRVGMYKKVFADIGDEQSIEQSVSTFSSHMRNIIKMLPEIDGHSLVLLDELGAGTDPAEGAGLARAILTTLLESQARAIVTTHYSELKLFAHEQQGVENASVEFDVESLSPTYRLIIGLPGRSQAIAIAKRLGMPQRVLALARQNISVDVVRAERLLTQIQEERRQIGDLHTRAQQLHVDARKIRDRVQSELTNLQHERDTVVEQARQESAQAVRELRQRLRRIEERAGSGISRREQRDAQAEIEDVQAVAARSLVTSASVPAPDAPVLQPVRPGAVVQILSLGQQGTVLTVAQGEAEVQFGQFKMRVPVDDLEVLSRSEREPERVVRIEASRPAPPMEIDIRGWRPDEAVRELDQYLHDNYLHGQPTVRIVHGKGTGVLRKAVHEQLDDHPLVQSFETEQANRGGDGVTIVVLAS